MKLDITPILGSPGSSLDFTFDESLEMLEGGLGTVFYTGPVHLEGKIGNFNGLMELEAQAHVPYQTQCDRCCEPISGVLSATVREDIVELPEVASESEGDAEEMRYTFTGHMLDLDVIASETILLQTPAYNLCQADCKGLCPECGVNLNREACGCGSHRPVDFRLEVLKRFSDPDET